MLDIERFVNRHFDVIDNYGSPITDLRVDCPFCDEYYGSSDRKQRLHVSLNKQVVHCFRCGYKRSWVGFVMDMLKCNYFQAIGEVYAKPNPIGIFSLFSSTVITGSKLDQEALTDIKAVGIWEKKGCRFLSAGRKYARDRGISEDLWSLYRLSVSDEIPYRLIIPIEDGYYQARAFYGWQSPKYINPKVGKDDAIFNASALHAYNEVVICEGAISAIHVGMSAVAVLGSEVTESQMKRLIDAPVESYVIASEENAKSKSVKTADRLVAHGKRVTVWQYLDGDPADSKKGYQEIEYNLKGKLQLLLH